MACLGEHDGCVDLFSGVYVLMCLFAGGAVERRLCVM